MLSLRLHLPNESSYPQRAPLTELKHPEHAVLELHRAVELGQVVIIDPQQLGRSQAKKWAAKHGGSAKVAEAKRRILRAAIGGRLTVLSSILCSSLKSPSVCFSSFSITGWRRRRRRRRTQRSVEPTPPWSWLESEDETLLYLLIVAASTAEVGTVLLPVLFDLWRAPTERQTLDPEVWQNTHVPFKRNYTPFSLV